MAKNTENFSFFIILLTHLGFRVIILWNMIKNREGFDLIELKKVTRFFGEKAALEGVELKINNGKIYGILGGYGAGKTVLLQLLAGVLRPTEGCVKINGFDMQTDALRAQSCIGYMPFPTALCGELTPYEELHFVAEARGLSELRSARSVHEALEATDTDRLRDRLIKNLTEAERRRIGIARTLVGNPEILLLDQPTEGLPHRDAEQIRELILSLGEHRTVILTTRHPKDARALCAQILVLRDGKVIANAPTEELADLEALVTVEAARPTRKAPERDGEYELIDTKERTK